MVFQTQSESRNRGVSQLPGRPCPLLTWAQQWRLKLYVSPLCMPWHSSISHVADTLLSFASAPSTRPLLVALSSLPPTSPAFKYFRAFLVSGSCLSSHHLLCLQFSKYDSTILQSHDLAKWTSGCANKLVTWLSSNLSDRFSFSFFFVHGCPLVCSWNFQHRW